MQGFTIIGPDNFYLKLIIHDVYGFPEKTSTWGGYDTHSVLEIFCYDYSVKSTIQVSTGNIYNFFVEFKKCYENLEGVANFDSFKHNLNFKMEFDKTGKVLLSGYFKKYHNLEIQLNFELFLDQSYLLNTYSELSNIFKKYGDNTGIKNVC